MNISVATTMRAGALAFDRPFRGVSLACLCGCPAYVPSTRLPKHTTYAFRVSLLQRLVNDGIVLHMGEERGEV